MIERDFMSRQARANDCLSCEHRDGIVLVLLLAVCMSVTLLACGPPPAPRHPVPPPDPQVLVHVSELPGDFLAHQEVHATFGSNDLMFQAVVQKRGSVLTIVTLGPDGSRAYLIEQSGKVVRSEKYVSRELPFSPMHILQDVHRCYFMAGESLPSSADGTGSTRRLRLSEYIEDDYREQALVRRVFRSVLAGDSSSSQEAGPTIATVEYSGSGDNLLERPVVYRNEELKYTLDIRPIAYSVLEPEAGDPATTKASPDPSASAGLPEAGDSGTPVDSPEAGDSSAPVDSPEASDSSAPVDSPEAGDSATP